LLSKNSEEFLSQSLLLTYHFAQAFVFIYNSF